MSHGDDEYIISFWIRYNNTYIYIYHDKEIGMLF